MLALRHLGPLLRGTGLVRRDLFTILGCRRELIPRVIVKG
jgi:hypothetical protein